MIPKIVLTGGPCAGKTSALEYLQERLRRAGWRAIVVPETATQIILGGVHDIERLANEERSLYLRVQEEILRGNLASEERFLRLAQVFENAGERCVLILDRGPMDVGAYVSDAEFEAMLAHATLSGEQLRDAYNGVVCLVTAADGAERAYTKANNAARREDKAAAIRADRRVREMWIGTPHFVLVDNAAPDFQSKLRRVTREVMHILGIPTPIEIEKKFLLRRLPSEAMLRRLGAVPVAIEQCYIPCSEGSERRIRKRGVGPGALFFETQKRELGRPGVREEVERRIDYVEYAHLRGTLLPGTVPINKTRYCLLWEGQYLEIDMFTSPQNGLGLLEIELTDEQRSVTLPSWLAIEREVTGESRFSNRHIANVR